MPSGADITEEVTCHGKQLQKSSLVVLINVHDRLHFSISDFLTDSGKQRTVNSALLKVISPGLQVTLLCYLPAVLRVMLEIKLRR